jgi:hypothetical protein
MYYKTIAYNFFIDKSRNVTGNFKGVEATAEFSRTCCELTSHTHTSSSIVQFYNIYILSED